MQLVPIPTTPEYLNASFNLWAPFLPDIAKRSPWSVEDLLRKLHRFEVQPVLVMDDGRPVALLGVTVAEEDQQRIGVLVWLTGKRREAWQHLLTDLESYLREHVHCVKSRAVCRPGWTKFLITHGYEQAGATDDKHVIMEKVL